jgi:hypothetical protein
MFTLPRLPKDEGQEGLNEEYIAAFPGSRALQQETEHFKASRPQIQDITINQVRHEGLQRLASAA